MGFLKCPFILYDKGQEKNEQGQQSFVISLFIFIISAKSYHKTEKLSHKFRNKPRNFNRRLIRIEDCFEYKTAPKVQKLNRRQSSITELTVSIFVFFRYGLS